MGRQAGRQADRSVGREIVGGKVRHLALQEVAEGALRDHECRHQDLLVPLHAAGGVRSWDSAERRGRESDTEAEENE